MPSGAASTASDQTVSDIAWAASTVSLSLEGFISSWNAHYSEFTGLSRYDDWLFPLLEHLERRLDFSDTRILCYLKKLNTTYIEKLATNALFAEDQHSASKNRLTDKMFSLLAKHQTLAQEQALLDALLAYLTCSNTNLHVKPNKKNERYFNNFCALLNAITNKNFLLNAQQADSLSKGLKLKSQVEQELAVAGEPYYIFLLRLHHYGLHPEYLLKWLIKNNDLDIHLVYRIGNEKWHVFHTPLMEIVFSNHLALLKWLVEGREGENLDVNCSVFPDGDPQGGRGFLFHLACEAFSEGIVNYLLERHVDTTGLIRGRNAAFILLDILIGPTATDTRKSGARAFLKQLIEKAQRKQIPPDIFNAVAPSSSILSDNRQQTFLDACFSSLQIDIYFQLTKVRGIDLTGMDLIVSTVIETLESLMEDSTVTKTLKDFLRKVRKKEEEQCSAEAILEPRYSYSRIGNNSVENFLQAYMSQEERKSFLDAMHKLLSTYKIMQLPLLLANAQKGMQEISNLFSALASNQQEYTSLLSELNTFTDMISSFMTSMKTLASSLPKSFISDLYAQLKMVLFTVLSIAYQLPGDSPTGEDKDRAYLLVTRLRQAHPYDEKQDLIDFSMLFLPFLSPEEQLSFVLTKSDDILCSYFLELLNRLIETATANLPYARAYILFLLNLLESSHVLVRIWRFLDDHEASLTALFKHVYPLYFKKNLFACQASHALYLSGLLPVLCPIKTKERQEDPYEQISSEAIRYFNEIFSCSEMTALEQLNSLFHVLSICQRDLYALFHQSFSDSVQNIREQAHFMKQVQYYFCQILEPFFRGFNALMESVRTEGKVISAEFRDAWIAILEKLCQFNRLPCHTSDDPLENAVNMPWLPIKLLGEAEFNHLKTILDNFERDKARLAREKDNPWFNHDGDGGTRVTASQRLFSSSMRPVRLSEIKATVAITTAAEKQNQRPNSPPN